MSIIDELRAKYANTEAELREKYGVPEPTQEQHQYKTERRIVPIESFRRHDMRGTSTTLPITTRFRYNRKIT